MYNLKISDYWINQLREHTDKNGEGYDYNSTAIDLINYQFCNISGFRYNLHVIIDIDNQIENKEDLHKLTSNNNFTVLVMLGILQVD